MNELAILVEHRLLQPLDGADDLRPSLTRFLDDLRADGFAPRMHVADLGREALRHTARRTPGLAGAVLVGAFDDDDGLLDGMPDHLHVSRIDARPVAPDLRRERRDLTAYFERNHRFRTGAPPPPGLRIITGHSDRWISVFSGTYCGDRRSFQWIWDDQIYAPSLRSQDNRAELGRGAPLIIHVGSSADAAALLFAGGAVAVAGRPRALRELPTPVAPDLARRPFGDVIRATLDTPASPSSLLGDWTLRIVR